MKNDCFIGEHLYALRKTKDPSVTKADVANAVGISPALYGMFENNKRPVSDKLLVRLADYYKVSLSDLTRDSEPYSLIKKSLSQIDDTHRPMMIDICRKYTTYLEKQEDFEQIGIDYVLILLLESMDITNIPEAKDIPHNTVKFPYFTYNKDKEILGLNFRHNKNAENVDANFWQALRSFYMPTKDIVAMQDDIRHYIIFYMCNYLRKQKPHTSTTENEDNGN